MNPTEKFIKIQKIESDFNKLKDAIVAAIELAESLLVKTHVTTEDRIEIIEIIESAKQILSQFAKEKIAELERLK